MFLRALFVMQFLFAYAVCGYQYLYHANDTLSPVPEINKALELVFDYAHQGRPEFHLLTKFYQSMQIILPQTPRQRYPFIDVEFEAIVRGRLRFETYDHLGSWIVIERKFDRVAIDEKIRTTVFARNRTGYVVKCFDAVGIRLERDSYFQFGNIPNPFNLTTGAYDADWQDNHQDQIEVQLEPQAYNISAVPVYPPTTFDTHPVINVIIEKLVRIRIEQFSHGTIKDEDMVLRLGLSYDWVFLIETMSKNEHFRLGLAKLQQGRSYATQRLRNDCYERHMMITRREPETEEYHAHFDIRGYAISPLGKQKLLWMKKQMVEELAPDLEYPFVDEELDEAFDYREELSPEIFKNQTYKPIHHNQRTNAMLEKLILQPRLTMQTVDFLLYGAKKRFQELRITTGIAHSNIEMYIVWMSHEQEVRRWVVIQKYRRSRLQRRRNFWIFYMAIDSFGRRVVLRKGRYDHHIVSYMELQGIVSPTTLKWPQSFAVAEKKSWFSCFRDSEDSTT